MTKDRPTPELTPQAQVMAQIANEDEPMPSDDDVKRIAREHRLPDTETQALVRFARAVTKMAQE
jgi:3,4-dihydroxy-2-butanone 4-phosphate synthase